MPGLVPGIHDFLTLHPNKTWMAPEVGLAPKSRKSDTSDLR